MLISDLHNQAFQLYYRISLALKRPNMSHAKQQRLLHAKKRAYSRYGRRLGFNLEAMRPS